MTESEAIERLYNMKNKVDVALMNSKYEKGHWLYDDVQGTADALRMAIKALEKQISKKIKVVEDIRLDGVKEYFAVCPNCDKGTRFCVGIGNYNKYSLKNWIGNCYCSNCGQKLNWESDEE